MSTPHARNIVRKLLANGKTLRIQEIYKRGLEEYPATPLPKPPPPKRFAGKKGILKPAPPQPPNPGHPFHSKSYLKDTVLGGLIQSGEVQKFHTVLDSVEEVQTKKRPTKSPEAMRSGKRDVWLWRLIGPQGEAGENPKLEDEPPVDVVGWYQENTIYPPKQTEKAKEKAKDKRDPYGAGPLDHLNKRRENARPEKLKLEEEWMKSVAAAREEGKRANQAS